MVGYGEFPALWGRAGQAQRLASLERLAGEFGPGPAQGGARPVSQPHRAQSLCTRPLTPSCRGSVPSDVFTWGLAGMGQAPRLVPEPRES